MSEIARRYHVTGRVQGVGFRYFVERHAKILGLRGWVRNLSDGSVELEATGTEAQLAELEGLLHRGPQLAQVRSVTASEATPTAYPSFRTRG
jgi:acylphosphatase